MRTVVLCSLAVLVILAGCSSGGGRTPGAGVDTIVLNHHELRDVYFQYYPGQTRPERVDDMPFGRTGDYVELFRLSTLVRNHGYADTLVAMYVTGYDPNLFEVIPLGPYIKQEGSRYCYKDIFIESGQQYQGYLLCAAANDVFFGGGVNIQDGDGIVGGRIDLYNINVGEYLDRAISWMREEETRLFSDLGLFNDVDINCNFGETAHTGSTGGIVIGGQGSSCRFSFGVPALYWNRASRGSLLLAMFGDTIRQCRNDCVVVPSPLTGKDYIAGDSANIPGGEGMYVDFGVFMDRGRWPPTMNDHDQLFQITTCYLYTTYVTPVVCIDPTPATQDGEACRAGIVQWTKPLPAPLSIDSIEQHNQGGQVAFTIHVSNRLSGTAFHPGAMDFCAPNSPDTYSRQFRESALVVDARVLGSLESLDCRDHTIRLQNGRGQITCTYRLPPEAYARGAYQTTLNIEIGYLYRDINTIATSIHRI